MGQIISHWIMKPRHLLCVYEEQEVSASESKYTRDIGVAWYRVIGDDDDAPNYNHEYSSATWAPAPRWMVPVRDRDDCYRHDRDDYFRGDRDDDNRSDRSDYNGYRPNYNQPNYYQPNYQPSYPPYANNYASGAQYYGAPAMGGGIASLLPQLMANAGQRGAGPYQSGYNANPYGYNQNQYGGYGNAGGIGSLIGPLLGNYLH